MGVSSISVLFLTSSQTESVSKGPFTATSDTTLDLRRTILAERAARNLFKSYKGKFAVIIYVSLICFIAFLKFLKFLEMLYDACENGDLEKVKDILSKDSSLLNEGLKEDGGTALYLASFYNHSLIVSFLSKLDNIDVNKADKVIMTYFNLLKTLYMMVFFILFFPYLGWLVSFNESMSFW
jgi:hypothetical protein